MKKLFSIILLILFIQSAFSQELSKGMEQTAWSSIRAKFMGESRQPIIYRKNISIRLEGEVTAIDSSIIIDLIDSLKKIIPKRVISLTPGNGNLIINFSANPGSGSRTSTIAYGKEIKNTKLTISLKKDIPKETRKKILYYYLYKSLVKYSQSNRSLMKYYPSKYGPPTINGCVFDENENHAENITYSPFDAFILSKLYASDFRKQYLNEMRHRFSYREYLVMIYPNELKNASFFLSLVCGLILIILFLLKGVFRTNRRSWSEYNKQGLFIILIGTVYWMITGLSEFEDKYR